VSTTTLPRLLSGAATIAAATVLVACSGGHPIAAGHALGPGTHGGPAGASTTGSSTSSTASSTTTSGAPVTSTTATTLAHRSPSTTAGLFAIRAGGPVPAAPIPAVGPPVPPTTRPLPPPPAPPPSSPPGTEAPWPPPGGGLPPGPPPSNYGPYGGYGLWHGTCDSTGGEYGYGQITTHWDQYRGSAAVQYIEIAAAFSATSTPKTPAAGVTYTNIQNVNTPTWGQPIPVGGRHQDGPLYLEFRGPTPQSVISVEFYWLDANHNVLWQSPTPLTWSC
jgi:hypothetical protein